MLAATLLVGAAAQAQLTANLWSSTDLEVDANGASASFAGGQRLYDGFSLVTGAGGRSAGVSIALTESSAEFLYRQTERMNGRSGSQASFGLSGGTMPHATTLVLESPQTVTGRLELSWSAAGFYPAEWDLGARIDVDLDGAYELDVDSVTGQMSVSASASLPLIVGPAGRMIQLETWGQVTSEAGPGISGLTGRTTIRFVPDQCQVTSIGAGCGPLLDIQTTFENRIEFDLSGVPTEPGSFGFLLVGNSRPPITLSSGCVLYVSPTFRLPMTSSGPGTASLSFPLGVPSVFSVQAGTYDGRTGSVQLSDAFELDCQ